MPATCGERSGTTVGRMAAALVVVVMPAPPPSAPVTGGAGTESDTLAAAVVLGVEHYWQARFPAEFHRRWINLHGFHAVDPGELRTPVPCLANPGELTDQALYCPTLDIVEWDRTGLIPRLRAAYGDAAVLVALAHEMGHAVAARLGIGARARSREPDRYPPILLEGMADCYAGVVVRAARDGQLPGITVTRPRLDRAVAALLSVRDPVGLALHPSAHGDAFDRISSFLDGYSAGALGCARMSTENQGFTQRGFGSLSDLVANGNLTLSEVMTSMVPDANGWFGALVTSRGRTWRPPRLALATPGRCDLAELARQGPARYCASDGTVSASASGLARVHDRLGDYASGVLLASRYALAALAALGQPVLGPDAGRRAVCLSGAYTRQLFDRVATPTFGLSPGDLDEAVRELLTQDFAARDASGQPPAGDLGMERVSEFRAGALSGPNGCGI